MDNGTRISGYVLMNGLGDVRVDLIVADIPNVGGVVLSMKVDGMFDMTTAEGILLLELPNNDSGAAKFMASEDGGVFSMETGFVGDAEAVVLLQSIFDEIKGLVEFMAIDFSEDADDDDNWDGVGLTLGMVVPCDRSSPFGNDAWGGAMMDFLFDDKPDVTALVHIPGHGTSVTTTEYLTRHTGTNVETIVAEFGVN